ncbi:heme-copper oxidase subunit III [Paraflavitalea sp. CAU 1676]|uniref:cytochrome c oxidase subunit 3 n=1 Tax=Paraflavitalea sp. CAU 1676 TaxID=3032598 RepID=UPI0023DAF9E6|nr:heme-copper oxidase subunit III [Paraflavitalea sp. CAU 1676]MDF2190902.1 heme-copper oxidase subunit III [Paraflavitalea sp. CAU 1676]
MNIVSSSPQKIHPHKFTLWIAIGSIIMMFAGLTSAYIVKGEQPGWSTVVVPKIFYYSTGVILISSLTMQIALKAFKERSMQQYRSLLTLTAVLGVVFIAMQIIGFKQLFQSGVKLEGGSGAGQFLYIIFGLHALHVLGGAIALLIMFLKAFSSKIRNYNSVPVEVISTYWHFVDLLWIYLFVFFLVKS